MKLKSLTETRSRLSPLSLFIFSFFFVFFVSRQAHGALLQIIHTNDLHSHFEHASKEGAGHYAAVKAVIDKIKYDAWDQQIETLVVDAGDFSEGTPFYLADKDEQSWKAMNVMNYDAVVIGNHDYLLGQKDLDRVIKNSAPDFFLLGANFHPDKKYPSLYKTMQPRARLERNGDWISVMGLTTDDYMYTWRVGKGTITSPIDTVNALVPKYRKDSKFVIAVTHLGIDDDRKMIYNTSGIDLVIGGHSHDALFQPIYQKAKDGKYVPIVQAGEHGDYVGDLLVDLVPGRPARVIRYRLVPVDINGPRNAQMANFVVNARKRLEAMYPAGFLSQQIGYSEVPLQTPKNGYSVWGEILGRGMMRVTKADVAVNAYQLFGDSVPGGPVTREKLFQFYPRVFEFSNFTTGWSVWTAEVEGYVLRGFLEEVLNQGQDIIVTGATYSVSGAPGNKSVSNLKINGNPLHLFAVTYKIALPEGVARVLANDYQASHLLDPIASSRVSMWAAMEIELNRRGGIVRAP